MQTSQQNKSGQTKALTEKGPVEAFEYAPSLEATDIVKISPRNKLFINGKWTEPSSGK